MRLAMSAFVNQTPSTARPGWRARQGAWTPFVALSLTTGLAQVIAIDSRVKGEAIWRTIFLYPLAVSFVVTSGGQRQRVAMGRALVCDPKLFLFDEPLSNLDAKLRVDMRAQIKKLRNKVGKTTVYVTHDQIEAMTLAMRIAVMYHGAIQQFDEPAVVYARPANMLVAGFMGSPSMNFIPATLVDAAGRLCARVRLDGGGFADLALGFTSARRPAQDRVILGVRPEHLFGFDAELQARKPSLASLSAPGERDIVGRFDPDGAPRLGELLPLGVDMSHACLFDPVDEILIARAPA